jgi:hypothetical protein
VTISKIASHQAKFTDGVNHLPTHFLRNNLAEENNKL